MLTVVTGDWDTCMQKNACSWLGVVATHLDTILKLMLTKLNMIQK